MKIAVIGAGAVGLYYGARLQQGGEDVSFLLRRDYDAISARGLQVHSVDGDFHLQRVKGYRTADEIGPVDLVLVALKAFSNAHYEALIGPLIGEKTAILTLQNGLGNEDQLAALFGPERIVGGIAFICSNRGEPGTVHHLGVGHIQIAEYNAALTERLKQLEALFNRCGVRCEAMPDLTKIRWEKLVWNIPFNGLCALMKKPTGQLLAHPETRALIIGLMHEVVTAANTQGISQPITERFIEKMVLATEPMGDYQPSMMIDRLNGQPLELAAIYGEPLRRAAEQGVMMPRTAMLHTLLDLDEPAETS